MEHKTQKTHKLLVTLILLLAIGVCAAAVMYHILTRPVTKDKDLTLFLYPDATADSIISIISESDSTASTLGLGLWLKYLKYDSNPRSGCYTVTSMASARKVAGILKGGMQTPVNITVRSCRNNAQMARTLASQLMADSTGIATLLNSREFLDSLGYTPATVFCMIIPDTYQVYWNVSPRGLLERLVKESSGFWTDERKRKADAIGLSTQQVMTLASIIEEETSMSDELPQVAGLYMNRLKKGMPLQADPTVIFALGGERPKRVLQAHLEVDSPYNTYKNPGLPPAPIRFVNPKSIDAVLNYSNHSYLYMCAKEDFSGYHNFATTYSQHMENARRYQRALNQRGIMK